MYLLSRDWYSLESKISKICPQSVLCYRNIEIAATQSFARKKPPQKQQQTVSQLGRRKNVHKNISEG